MPHVVMQFAGQVVALVLADIEQMCCKPALGGSGRGQLGGKTVELVCDPAEFIELEGGQAHRGVAALEPADGGKDLVGGAQGAADGAHDHRCQHRQCGPADQHQIHRRQPV